MKKLKFALMVPLAGAAMALSAVAAYHVYALRMAQLAMLTPMR
ncbi:MAG TPA: hypothetical protein VL334_00645 [Anaerolineae bacterium]|nr:hypothetical protein [Anaerolineae bacterium]